MNNSKILFVVFTLIVIFAAGIILLNNKQVNKTTTQPIQTNINTKANSAQELQKKEAARKEVVVNVAKTGFTPQTINIKTGTRVIWINKTENPVTVNSAEHPTHLVYPPLNLGEFGKNSSVQLVFEKLGTYRYHNHLIPDQTGVVVVK